MQTAELTASDGGAGDELGYSVAVSGGAIIAGAPEHAVAGAGARGAAYVFSQPASSVWKNSAQTAELTASDGGAGDELGSSVAFSGGAIAVGAPEHATSPRGSAGAAYVFATPTPAPPDHHRRPAVAPQMARG